MTHYALNVLLPTVAVAPPLAVLADSTRDIGLGVAMFVVAMSLIELIKKKLIGTTTEKCPLSKEAATRLGAVDDEGRPRVWAPHKPLQEIADNQKKIAHSQDQQLQLTREMIVLTRDIGQNLSSCRIDPNKGIVE